jgi:geranylgeranyl diphosphate synthase type I
LIKDLNLACEEVNAELFSVLADGQEPRAIYEASKHLIGAGGKRIRPFLTLKACEIVGGRREDALPIAASIELIHNFTLVHDDIMDDDDTRRGVATVHVLWGIPIAIIAGDMLFAKAYESASRAKTSPSRLLEILATVTDVTISICEGQTLDMLFEKRRDVSEKEYLDMIYKKTAALLEAAAKAGALIGGGSPRQVRSLGELARYAGLAFQIIDDILGLTADEKTLGKPVGSDIREGKSTILIIHALKNANMSQRKKILSIVGDNSARPHQIETVIQMIQDLGSVKYAIKKSETLIDKAKAQLSSFPTSQSKDRLLDLCDYFVLRKY